MKKLFIIPALVMYIQTANAKGDSLISGEMQNYIGFGAIIFMMLLFVIVLLVLLRTFKVMTRVILRLQGYTNEEILAEMQPAKKEKKAKKEDVWIKLLSLKPMAEEKEILIEHDYDGIQELDNPTPAWFMYLFYGTIIFAVGYLLNYHVFHTGQLQYDEYKTEMADADAAKKIYLSHAANQVDENTVKLVIDP